MNLLTEFRKTIRHFQKQYHEHDENAPILRVQGISMRYDSGMALDSVSFAIERGVRLAIVGPNGAGKSTLIKIVAGVMEPTSGQIQVHGNEPVQHICIGYVPQRSQVDWGFPVSVMDVVMMGRIGKMGLFRNPNRQDHEICDQALETVGLQDLAKRQIGQLSGGQQQRMFIARALAQQAQLLLMDEPFTGLDVNSREDIFNILDRLSSQRVTVLVSLHDLNLAAAKFDQVVLLKKKLLAFGEPETALSSQNLLTAYGSQLHLVDINGGRLAIEDSCCGEEGHQHD